MSVRVVDLRCSWPDQFLFASSLPLSQRFFFFPTAISQPLGCWVTGVSLGGGYDQSGRRRHLYAGEVFVPGSQRLPRRPLFGADVIRIEWADAGESMCVVASLLN